MLTDRPFHPVDRSSEIWLEVDAQRAATAYSKGADAIEAAMPEISRTAHAYYGTRPAPGAAMFGGEKRLLADLHIKGARNTVILCRLMARTLSAGTGAARMPASEVSAWLSLADGSTLARYLNPTR